MRHAKRQDIGRQRLLIGQREIVHGIHMWQLTMHLFHAISAYAKEPPTGFRWLARVEPDRIQQGQTKQGDSQAD